MRSEKNHRSQTIIRHRPIAFRFLYLFMHDALLFLDVRYLFRYLANHSSFLCHALEMYFDIISHDKNDDLQCPRNIIESKNNFSTLEFPT